MDDELFPTPSCTVGPFFPTHYFGALDNDRYGTRSWTTARDVLAAHHAK